MKRYQLGLLLLGALLLSGCGIAPQEEKSPQTGDVAQQEILTGEITTGATTPISEFPECTPIKLRPFEKREPIDIEQVAVNCTYEEGEMVGLLFGGGGRRRSISLMNDDFYEIAQTDEEGYTIKDESTCHYGEFDYSSIKEGSPLMPSVNFLKRHKLAEKKIVNEFSRSKDDQNILALMYGCKEDNICKKLITPPYGELGDNYFIYGYDDIRDSTGDNYHITKYLIINDKIYKIRKWIEEFNNEDERMFLPYAKEGDWNVVRIEKNKVIVNKYTQGQLSTYYKENYKNFEEGNVIGTYKVKTCEIPL